MSALAPLQLMADYNRWMNERIYLTCATIPDDIRKRDLGAFFHSIHGTLNHLLLVDRLWLGRITGLPFQVQSLAQELYPDFTTLRQEREQTDAELQTLIASLTAERLAQPVTYVSVSKGTNVTLSLGLLLTHLFNHQTHHRGQLTTLLSQLGYDYGDTDLIFMPGAKEAEFSPPARSH